MYMANAKVRCYTGNPMMIFGVDPGTARMGWGIIDTNEGNVHAVQYGCITTNKTETPGNRLLIIYTALTSFLTQYTPDVISLEELFFATNAKTVIPVGESRGIVLLAAAQKHIPVVSYSPLAVKRAITGDGKADKTQVQRMVTRLLHLPEIPKPDDTADALAIALTHAYSYKMKGKTA